MLSKSSWGMRGALLLLGMLASASLAADAQPPVEPDDKSKSQPEDPPPPRRRQYPNTRSPAANSQRDRPDYVRQLPEGLDPDSDWRWLDIGIEQRKRFESREDFYRAGRETDYRYFMRTRAFIGVRDKFDPLRFGMEFQDSRRFGSQLPETTRNIDEAELLQAFGELYFADALGEGRPLSFRAGRMSFDAVDRRLFARNRFRNTTDAFDGFRLRLGDEQCPWELDIFAFQPVVRRVRQFDRPDHDRWIYGINYYWRGWSPWITLEPYYFILDEDFDEAVRIDREIHTLGLHGFGLFGESGFDYDFNFAFQFGDREDGNQRAFACHTELGYTFEHEWKPRIAAMFDYASGDSDPTDNTHERFDPMFGAAHTFYGYSDLFGWHNMINPAVYLSFRPTKKAHIEAYYRAHWLATDRDAFVRGGISDAMGGQGRFVGQEIDLRFRYKLNQHADLDLGYAYFFPGDFVENVGDTTEDSDFFYVQMRLKL